MKYGDKEAHSSSLCQVSDGSPRPGPRLSSDDKRLLQTQPRRADTQGWRQQHPRQTILARAHRNPPLVQTLIFFFFGVII